MNEQPMPALEEAPEEERELWHNPSVRGYGGVPFGELYAPHLYQQGLFPLAGKVLREGWVGEVDRYLTRKGQKSGLPFDPTTGLSLRELGQDLQNHGLASLRPHELDYLVAEGITDRGEARAFVMQQRKSEQNNGEFAIQSPGVMFSANMLLWFGPLALGLWGTAVVVRAIRGKAKEPEEK